MPSASHLHGGPVGTEPTIQESNVEIVTRHFEIRGLVTTNGRRRVQKSHSAGAALRRAGSQEQTATARQDVLSGSVAYLNDHCCIVPRRIS